MPPTFIYDPIYVFFLPPCEVSEGIVCLSTRVSYFVHLSTFNITLRSECDIIFTPKVHFVLSVILMITILIKILHMI